MTPEQWERVKTLFGRALQMDAGARVEFLDLACADDLAVRLEVQRLLEEHDRLRDSFLQTPATRTESTLLHRSVFSRDDLVSSRYRIVRFVDKGGMGEVYEAADLELAETVALKTLLLKQSLSDDALARFKREIQLGRRVINPHVCRIHDLGRHCHPQHGDILYLTMEFLRGESLSRRIRSQGRFSTTEALPLVRQMISALGSAHRLGIIHRDFKSSNVMLVSDGDKLCAKVTDFGLARSIDCREGGTLTSSGLVMGTPAYMPPEQFRGEATKASDIYALGVVMHEMVTGVLPFNPEVPAELRVAVTPRCQVPDLDVRWETAILCCLHSDASSRLTSVEQVDAALTRDASHQSTTRASAFSTFGRAWRSKYTVLAPLILLLLVSGALIWRSSHRRYTPLKSAVDWYDKGIEAFREGTYLKAAELLQSALNVDKNFAVARARLADAWSELDFKGNADEEMLAVSTDLEGSVGPLERSYIEAVRAILGRDFRSAIQHFHEVLNQSETAERPACFVDLGRAYEKAGEVPAALDAYRQARNLSPDSPTPYLRLAVLESRQGSNVEAASDFDRAFQLYTKLGSLEGTAEVAYQRSYWNSVLHRFKEAREQAQKSFDAARAMPIPSVQLEVRALCRFSGSDDQAIDDASKALVLAHENGLEYWETDALLRQGAGYLGKHDFASTRNCFDKALKAAERNHWPRLIALSQVNMAVLRDQQGQPQDLQRLAVAMEFYRIYQFPIESVYPLLLLAREKNNQSLYSDALHSGAEVLAVVQKLGDPILIAQAEEVIGTTHLGLQNYPEGLKCFDAAVDAANQAHDPESASYNLAHRADVLSRLGRFDDAQDALRKLTSKDLVPEARRLAAHILFSQGKFHRVVQITQAILLDNPNLEPAAAIDFRIVGSMAASEAGLLNLARRWADTAISLAEEDNNAELLANANLARVRLSLRSHEFKAAKSYAEGSLAFFQMHGQRESEWMALYYLAQAENALANKDIARQTALKALDIVDRFEHNWDASAFQSYTERADVSAACRELRLMARP